MKTNHRFTATLAVLAALLGHPARTTAQTVWTGVSGVSASTNWSDTANWSTAASPAGTDVLFGDLGAAGAAGTINSVVDDSFQNPFSLTFTNMSQNTLFHTVFIPAGVELANASTLTVGGVSAPTVTTTVNFAGGGTLIQNGPVMNVKWINGSAGGSLATLDLSALSNFVYNSSSGTITIASAGSGSEARGGGIVTLAASSNHITVGTLAMALGTGNGGVTVNALNLGAGTNIINAGTVNIAAGKINTAAIKFNSSTGGLRLRGVGGTDSDRANFTLGRRGNTGSGAINGNMFLNDHPVDILADTMTIGISTANQSGQTVTGNLQFNQGKIDANAINLAACSGNAGAIANGVVTVGGGVLTAGSISLVNQTLGIATGNLNISGGGAVICASSVLKTTTAGVGNITISTGSLSVSNAIGSVSAPIDNFSISDATLVLPAGVSASANATTLTCGGATNKINVTDLPVVAGYPSQFPLIKYAGVLGGTFNVGLGTLPASSPAYTGYISNNTANGSIDVVITGGPMPARVISWRGTPSGDWDTTTANWLFSAAPTTYNQADFVRFEDGASGTTEVNLTTTLLPTSITVSNESKTYGFTGFGILSGETGLNKDGAGTLYITNSGINDFTGPINILAGTVRVGDGNFSGNLGSGDIANNGALVFNRADFVTVANNISGSGDLTKQGVGVLTISGANSYTGATFVNSGTLNTLNNAALGATTGATTISSGASLDVNARNLGAEPVLISGTGDAGLGAIVNSGAQALNALRYVTLLGNTTVGGAGRWDIRAAPSTGDPSLAGLSTGGNAYKLTKIGFNQVSLVGVTVDPALGDVEVQQGVLSLETATTGLGNPANSVIVAAGASLQFFQLTNQLNKVISLTSDSFTPSIINNSGANTVVGPITMTTDSIFNVNGTSLNVAGSLAGGLLIKQGTGNFIISGNATHAGTTVNVGTFTLDGAHSGGVTNTSTFASFAGSGTNSGFTDIAGNLLPGGTNVIGTLTLNGLALQFGGVVGFELNSTTGIGGGTNDLIVVNGDLTISGNTIVINPPGLLKTGSPYRLFNYTGTLIENAPLFVPDVNGYSFTVDTTTPGQINLIASGGGPVWNGGSATGNNWTDAANWSGVNANPNETLFFTGSARLNNTNDTPADTSYLNVIFNSGAGAFTLNGNPITLTGNILNNSSNPQKVNLGVNFNTARTLNGSTAPLIIGGGLTNTAAGYLTTTLAGTGTLTNLLGNTGGGTNVISMNGTNANWTLADNSLALPITVPWAFSISNGTFNFGVGSSAPVLNSTTVNGAPTDNQLGTVANANAVFNMVAGTLTTAGRFNTATALNATGIVNQVGGTWNLGNQFQGANGGNAGQLSVMNISGGTMNIGSAATPNSPFYLASRGNGVLTLSGSGALNCGNLDLARNAAGNTISCNGTVNLDGGTLAAQRVGTAIANAQTGTTFAPSATFNFNGGTLKARANSGTWFQGSTAAPIIPIVSIVKSGGAIFDTDGFNVSVLEALQHDSALGGTPDGGLTKNGAGTLTLTAASTYTGPTVVNNGTLLINGSIGTAASVETGGTLGGTGNINNNVTVKSGGTITAGAANAAGNLTVAGNVTMQAGATCFMELNKTAASNDQLRAIAGTATTITYAGTLSLNNLAGTLAPGDSFKLFSATNYAGSFSAITPATPGDGLQWVTSALNTSGTISVAILPIPKITSIGMVGSNLVISGTNGPANGTYWVLTSTDVSLPLASWTSVATNTFNGSGNFSYTNGAATDPQRFYTVLVP